MASTVLSQTLRSLTDTKIKELEKQRTSYKTRKEAILGATNGVPSVEDRLSRLLEGINNQPESSWYRNSKEGKNAVRLLWQAKFDPSIGEDKLLDLENQLRAHLDRVSRKLDLAHLYSRLLTEWIDTPATSDNDDAEAADSGSEESFDVLPDTQKERLEQLREKFAKVVFEPFKTDEAAIDAYLRQLFTSHAGEKALEVLRSDVTQTGKHMLEQSFEIDDQTLKWCIKGLLKNELLNDEKKTTLKDFLKDEAVLTEIRDVLNMRFRNLSTWEWDLGEEGMPVVPRQSLNGKWRVMMDEDVLQALLTHWIGTIWAVRLKKTLLGLRRWGSLWRKGSFLPEDQRAKFEYYLYEWEYESMVDNNNVEEERLSTYTDHFFISSLPSKMFEEAGGYDDDDEPPETDPNKLSPKDVKQLLLRTLATEVILQRSLNDEVAVVQSDFQWFATGMSHSTIFAVLRFMGFQEEWISFFQKALSPPMDMLDGKPAKRRQRGLPMAHVFEKLLGELVLFFMDLAVAQSSSMLLYRSHDDLWLVGKPSHCAKAWQSMEAFATVMGLEFNKHKTGSVYITSNVGNRDSKVEEALPTGQVAMNFLDLDRSGRWTINQDHVQQHVKQLQKQLSGSKSVLQWTKTWNSCIGRFFSYTFGEPAHCFGREHLDRILQQHNDMQRFLFDGSITGSTVIEHLRRMVAEHFQVDDVPSSFFFMPESLGGLGLKNPFSSLIPLRSGLEKSPDACMKEFVKNERQSYENAKRTFDNLTEKERRKRYKTAFLGDDDDEANPVLSWEQAQVFMSFDEYTAHRELTSSSLYHVYNGLLKPATAEPIDMPDRVESSLRSLKYTPEGLDTMDGDNFSYERLWTVVSFEDELFEKFGGIEVVDRGLLPLGVLKAMKERKVTWQMVL